VAIHLFVVGKEEPFGGPCKKALERAKEIENEFLVRTCNSPTELLGVVREAVLLTGQRISTLDIFDHGAQGVQKLGNEVLFAASSPPDPAALKSGAEIARRLSLFLTPDARVRLLGCKTALGATGQTLLLSLQREIGAAVVVFGTNALADAAEETPGFTMDPGEFGARGFKALKEDEWLFSSTEARDRQAPDQEARGKENEGWIEEIRRL
jgi:hypothetical protein